MEIFPFKADVAVSSSVEGMIRETLARFGQLDILVNAAGVISVSPVMEMEGNGVGPHDGCEPVKGFFSAARLPFRI